MRGSISDSARRENSNEKPKIQDLFLVEGCFLLKYTICPSGMLLTCEQHNAPISPSTGHPGQKIKDCSVGVKLCFTYFVSNSFK